MIGLSYKNKSLEPIEGEIWVDAIYFDGIYSVSNLGRVKSERRFVNNGNGGRWVKERILSQWISKEGRLSVHFSVQNVISSHAISVLVWESFNEETPNGKIVMHKNKNQSDNRLCNLKLTTISDSHSVNFRLGLLPHLEQHHLTMLGSRWNEKNGIYENGELIEKLCNKCFISKSINEFEYNRNCCKECRSKSFGISEFGKVSYLKSLAESGLKRCHKCKEVKSINEFHKGTSKCKKCKNKSYERNRNPPKVTEIPINK